VTEPVFWIAVGMLSAGVALAVAAPLLRAGVRIGRARRASYDLAVFRDQLAELDRDRDAGRLNEKEALAAKAEIERRMLRAVDARTDADLADRKDQADPPARVGAAFPLAVGLVVAGAAVAIYVNTGDPGLRDAPLAGRTDLASAGAAGGPGQGAPGVDGQAMIQNLKDRLARNPNDVAGWITLARTYSATGQHMEAVAAFEKAISAAGPQPPAELISDYGEAQVLEAFGTVSPRAVETFRQALARDPGDIKSRFYIGMSRAQTGDFRGAIALWRGLTADAPPDAPWLEAVRERISEAAMKGGVMPMSVEPERFGGGATAATPGAGGVSGAIAGDARPTREQVESVQQMAPEDRMAFIRTMVDGLAEKMQANPDDIDGWVRLGRAYKVLGETEKSKQALGEAKSRLEDLLAAAAENSPTRPAVEATLREVEGMLAE